MGLGVNPAAAGLLGGMGGGIAQAYATMGKSAAVCIYPPQWLIRARFLHLYENGGDHAA